MKQTKIRLPETDKGPFKYVNTFDRKVLNEGRLEGLAFAFCKREGNTFTGVGPQSSCKDYLNEQLYSEVTGKPMEAYGYKSHKCGLFEGAAAGYIVLSVVGTKNGGTYPQLSAHKDNLEKNHKDCESYMEHFENLLGVGGKTELLKVADNVFIACVPLWWCRFTYLISLYSLLLRYAIEGGYSKDKGDPRKFAEGCKNGDCMMMAPALAKFDKMVKGKFPVIDWNDYQMWHSYGIHSVSF